MKMVDIQNLSSEDLVKKEADLREEYGNLSFQHKLRPLENSAKLREIRRDIARILTYRNNNS